MVCPSADGPSMRRQCELLGVSRSSMYYEATRVPAEDLALMRRVDELHLKYPFYGSRRISAVLKKQGLEANRKHVQRLMRHMGLEGLAPKPPTSTPGAQKPRFPYLLRDLTIDRVNQVWAADITYVPMARGFGYLIAIMDWASRRVLSWRLSNTMDPQFCLDALSEALGRFPAPGIFNTDQGAQFTACAWTTALLDRGVAVSMDGKGRWMDNVFVERLWRSLKYEEIYLHAYDDLSVARSGIRDWFAFYNDERPHQALGYQTPRNFYDLMAKKAA